MRAIPGAIWIKGEVAAFSQRNGHRYFDLVEHRPGQRDAHVQTVIWANRWAPIQKKLIACNLDIRDGQEMLFRARLDLYHGTGALSLHAIDVLPEFSLGQLEARRREILARLKQEGLCTLNSRLPFSDLPYRIGVISTRSGKGLHDFLQVLRASGFGFQAFCYDVAVQGPDTEPTVCAALQYFAKHQARLQLDALCIVRGGGNVTDLAAWNSFAIASAVARMPVPVICGIGHDLDRVVLDEVVHRRAATPTAAAQCLVDKVGGAAAQLRELRQAFRLESRDRIEGHHKILSAQRTALADVTRALLRDCHTDIAVAAKELQQRSCAAASNEEYRLRTGRADLQRAGPQVLRSAEQRLAETVRSWRHAVRTALEAETRHLRGLRRDLAVLSHAALIHTGRRMDDLREAVRDAACQQVATEKRIGRQLKDALASSCLQFLAIARKQLAQQTAALDDRDPTALLQRGYSLTVDQAGRAIRDATSVRAGETITSYLANGELRSVVTDTDSTIAKVQNHGVNQATSGLVQESHGRAKHDS